jgi:hypothetical protein
MITGVAIKKNGVVYVVYQAKSHTDVISHYRLKFDPTKDEMGFVASGDRFVSRYDAVEIARESRQLPPDFPGRELFCGDFRW